MVLSTAHSLFNLSLIDISFYSCKVIQTAFGWQDKLQCVCHDAQAGDGRLRVVSGSVWGQQSGILHRDCFQFVLALISNTESWKLEVGAEVVPKQVGRKSDFLN